MTEIRCKKCNRLLMKADRGCCEIKCPKCGYVNHINMSFVTAIGKMTNGQPYKYVTGEKVVEVF